MNFLINSPKRTIAGNVVRLLSTGLVICLFVSCAQMVSPGGGPVDKKPPVALHYSPDSGQCQFTNRPVQIDFDEYIQLKDLNTQLVISPPLQKMPDIKIKKKSLIIQFDEKEQFKPATTYSINFGSALQDLNEGNPLDNFRYLFSTGNYIDSMHIDGTVENGFNQRTEKGILVLLYANASDSSVFKEQPDYFCKTAVDGSFHLTNVKSGSYRIFAVKDLNGNFRYDVSEPVAFCDNAVTTAEKDPIKLKLFEENSGKVHLKIYQHDQYGKISLLFDQGTDSISVNLLDNTDKGVQAIYDFSAKHDSLTLWLKNVQSDSVKLCVRNGNTVIDTIEFKWIKKEEALKSKKHPYTFSMIASPDGNTGVDLNTALSLRFNQRIADPAKPIEVLLKNGDGEFQKFTATVYRDQLFVDPADTLNFFAGSKKNLPNKKATTWKEGSNYDLMIVPGVLSDVFGTSNDSILIHFKTKQEKFYGNLKLNTQLPESTGNYLVQLLDEREQVIRQDTILAGSQTISFAYLYPQKYKLKLIVDRNKNHVWDSGNLLQKKQPEQVLYNKETFMIRSNWDLELDWKLDQLPN